MSELRPSWHAVRSRVSKWQHYPSSSAIWKISKVKEFVAGDPVVIVPVFIIMRGVPPATALSAAIVLVVHLGAFLPDPGAVTLAVFPGFPDGAGDKPDKTGK